MMGKVPLCAAGTAIRGRQSRLAVWTTSSTSQGHPPMEVPPAVSIGALEFSYHNGAHSVISGWLATGSSPRDPLFYLLHANVDRAWALWQDQHKAFDFSATDGKSYPLGPRYPGPSPRISVRVPMPMTSCGLGAMSVAMAEPGTKLTTGRPLPSRCRTGCRIQVRPCAHAGKPNRLSGHPRSRACPQCLLRRYSVQGRCVRPRTGKSLRFLR